MKKKNKPFTVILVVVVGIVWVNVIIKVINNLSAEQLVDNQLYNSINNFSIPSSEERDFTLKVNYKDPFLRPVAIAKHTVTADGETKTTYVYDEEYINSGYATPPSDKSLGQNAKKSPQLTATPKPFVWPTITYHGIVRRTGNDKGLVVLKVKNDLLKLRKGDEFNTDFKIEEVFRDSILIRHKEDIKMFYR